jgi:hypothetical protein
MGGGSLVWQGVCMHSLIVAEERDVGIYLRSRRVRTSTEPSQGVASRLSGVCWGIAQCLRCGQALNSGGKERVECILKALCRETNLSAKRKLLWTTEAGNNISKSFRIT